MDDDDIGTVRWFGQSWHAPINDPRAEVPVPVNQDCMSCHLPIGSDDQGVEIPYYSGGYAERQPWHKNCFFDEIGVPHE